MAAHPARATVGALPAAVPRTRQVSLDAFAPCLVLTVALGAWALALGATDLTRVSGYGLLAALPPAYFIALLLAAAGFALEAARPQPRAWVLAAHVLAVVVMLHATTALLYPEPRYAWTYKHLGVIDYIAVHGSVDRSVDVYHNWPGFFALNAWFSALTGLAPIGYAGWAQLFFGLVNVGAVVFALRGLTRDPRLVWTAAWLFTVANWIGQDYLAPQAFGFVLVQVILGLIIRCTGPPPPPRTWFARHAVRTLATAQAKALQGRWPRRFDGAPCPVSPGLAGLIGGVCAVVVVVSHQLSPVLLILSVGALTVVRRGPPLWVLGGLIALEAMWLFQAYDFVSQHFKVFDFDPSAGARTAVGGDPLAGVALGADASRAAILLTLLLAVAGAVRRLRAGHWDLVPATLAAAPFLVLGFQSYDGEGPLRAFLFALPWLAFFGAAACEPEPLTRGLVARSWRPVVASLIIGTGALFGYFGQELVNYMSRDDVSASRWYLDHAAPGATLTTIAPSFPERLNARYSTHLDALPSFITAPGYKPHRLGPRDVPALEALLRRHDAPQRYVAISPSQARFARFHGLAPPGSMTAMTAALERSRNFKLVYRRGGGAVFRYSPL